MNQYVLSVIGYSMGVVNLDGKTRKMLMLNKYYAPRCKEALGLTEINSINRAKTVRLGKTSSTVCVKLKDG